MKYKHILPGLLVLLAFACNKPVKGKNGVTYKSPVQYNDYIVSRQTDLMKKVVDFSNVAETNIDSAATMLKGYAAETATMIDEIRGMPAYKGDTSLRNAAVNSFSFYKRVFEEDYVDIINIRKNRVRDCVRANFNAITIHLNSLLPAHRSVLNWWRRRYVYIHSRRQFSDGSIFHSAG